MPPPAKIASSNLCQSEAQTRHYWQKVKKDTALPEVGLSVVEVFEILAGNVLLDRNNCSQFVTVELSSAMSKVLGANAIINTKLQAITLEVEFLDETVTKGEVYAVMVHELGNSLRS